MPASSSAQASINDSGNINFAGASIDQKDLLIVGIVAASVIGLVLIIMVAKKG